MARLIPMQRYRVELPRYKFPKPLTYMGLAEGDYRCMVCEREGGTRVGWSARHSFVEGDPDNPTDQVIVGTECIKKCKITPEAATESRQEAQRGEIVSIDASRTPYKVRTDDGGSCRVSTQGAAAIRKLRVGDRVELEWYGGEWLAFPERSKQEGRMGTMRDVFGRIEESELSEAKFPSPGKGMEWGEYEQVTPENLAGYVERLKADEGMFVIATYTRMTWFDAKMWAKWEAVGKPMIRVAKDGKGLYSLEGKKYVFSPSTSPSVKWVPKQPEARG